MDFFGTILLLLVGFGWAKPVPMNIENFKYPRLYSVLTGLAGPFANFFLAFISFLSLKYLLLFNLTPGIQKTFLQLLETLAYVNVMLGTFNLIPIPPLDGSHFLFAFLYKRFPQAIIWLYRYSLFILLLLLLVPGFNKLLFQLIFYVYDLIKSLVF